MTTHSLAIFNPEPYARRPSSRSVVTPPPTPTPTAAGADDDVVAQRRRTISATLELLHTMAQKGEHRATAKAIHDYVFEHRTDVTMIDALLRTLEPSTVTSYELVSLLIETRAMSEKLVGRRVLLDAAKTQLVQEVGLEEATVTLRFL